VDLSQRPPINAKKSFEAFDDLIKKYPHSEYDGDARQRMVFLRNRLADFELHVALYYMRRGAYVGALNRAKYCVENYDGAPAVRGSMKVLVDGPGGRRRAGLRRQLSGEFPGCRGKEIVVEAVPVAPVREMLSIIVNFFNNQREAENTLHSLTRGYQDLAADIPYEVIALDNGSKHRLSAERVGSFGPEFRYKYFTTKSASPAAAINSACRDTVPGAVCRHRPIPPGTAEPDAIHSRWLQPGRRG
jgi:hypothetical protein